ncbi:S-layer homology domain-containing protein [Paenibacillus sp. 19GGS1-52]|uniref:S-layer homology domain-containing protein n=1 Tax=Paenibacillus sp. 19GGS1-52 TaxID=2758563 RepID=UPI001EFBA792|nr:S-layer homology domain-containing protein [Paenibacillus sp. 19GGS1-52]ULO06746.1 S-layer homology domain-containing protein [Paenibacillus sp. 19GGS1-52]
MKKSSIWRMLLISALVLVVLSGCAVNKSTVIINYLNGNPDSSEQVFLRYSDGTVVQAPDPGAGIVATVSTDITKMIVGGYVTDNNVSWVPNIAYYLDAISVQISKIQETKPTHAVDHVVLAKPIARDSDYKEYVDVTFAVYGTDGKLVDGSTEVFVHASDPNLEFYEYDNGWNTVKEGDSNQTVNGLVTFRIHSDTIDVPTAISLYSGSKLIADNFFHKVTGIDVRTVGDVYSLHTGESLAMNAAILPKDAANQAVTWSVVDGTGSATIDADGLLNAVSAGTVTVRATAADGSGIVGSRTITIDDIPVDTIAVSAAGGISTVVAGSLLNMSATVAPANATNQAVTWSVVNGTGSATIDGTSGELTAGDPGTVTVQAAATDGSGIVGSIQLTVTAAPIPVSSITITGDSSVQTGQNIQLAAISAPANATNQAVTWSVVNGTGSATIDGTSGELTAGDPGTVTVQAAATDGSGIVGSIQITVTALTPPPVTILVHSITVTGDPSVQVGQSIQLATTVTPAKATNPTVEWSVYSGTGTASIDVNGLLTGITVGTVTVKATATDGSAVFGSTAVEITAVNTGGSTPTPTPTPISTPTPTPTPISTPTPTPTPIPSSTPTPTPSAQPVVKFNDQVVNIEQVISSIKQKIAEAGANPTPSVFTDTTSHWAAASIDLFIKLGVVNGYSDGSFHPNASITRAEFSTIIVKLFDLSTTVTGSTLSDVSGHWAESSITTLQEKGIVSGYSNGTFKPNFAISRSEIISIISKIIDLNNVVTTTSLSNFSDIDNTWNKAQIEKAAAAGIIRGEGKGAFLPDKQASRAEALTIVLRVLQTNPELNVLLESMK